MGSFDEFRHPGRFWLALALAAVAVIVRGFWFYRASLTWPTADGVITALTVERRHGASTAGGHYFRATFTYEFRHPDGRRLSGTWPKDFSSETDASDFATSRIAHW